MLTLCIRRLALELRPSWYETSEPLTTLHKPAREPMITITLIRHGESTDNLVRTNTKEQPHILTYLVTIAPHLGRLEGFTPVRTRLVNFHRYDRCGILRDDSQDRRYAVSCVVRTAHVDSTTCVFSASEGAWQASLDYTFRCYTRINA